jgi:hypothetical protein
MNGITKRSCLVVLALAFGVILLRGDTGFGAGHWQIDDYYAPVPYLPPNVNDTSHSHYYRIIHFDKRQTSNPADCLGRSYCGLGGECDVSVWGGVYSYWEAYSGNVSVNANYGPQRSVKFVWHPENGEPSPGIVLSWDIAGYGTTYIHGLVDASPGHASAYSSASGSTAAGGWPGDEECSNPGGMGYVAGNITANGSGFSYSQSDACPASDDPWPTDDQNAYYADSYDCSAQWSCDGEGSYWSSPGISAIWVSGSASCDASGYVSVSVPSSYSGHAYVYSHSYSKGGYSFEAFNE